MFRTRFFIVLGICIALAVAGAWWPLALKASKWLVYALVVASIVDGVAVLIVSRTLQGRRRVSEYLSLDQPNPVEVTVSAWRGDKLQRWFNFDGEDTPPHSFRVLGDKTFSALGDFRYNVVPTSRGCHEFGVLRGFVSSRVLGLIRVSRFLKVPQMVKVYPTFKCLDKLEVMASENSKLGAKRMRRAGNSTDFNQIRAYVPGDDVRTINWRASARATQLMVNTYTDERSKPIIPILCAGPSMLIASDGISLLDRATSAAIALASSVMRHYDEVGLICATHRGVVEYRQPERASATLPAMLETTYAFGLPPTESEIELVDDPDVLYDEADQQTIAKINERMDACAADADYDALADFVQAKVTRRSMLVLFANFENISSAKQALPAMLRMAKRNTLVLVLFRNESVEETLRAAEGKKLSSKLSEQRLRVMCAHYLEQQQLLAAFLRQNHINVIFTPPSGLTASVLSTYLELKNRGAI